MNIIVISLKEEFYSHADALVSMGGWGRSGSPINYGSRSGSVSYLAIFAAIKINTVFCLRSSKTFDFYFLKGLSHEIDFKNFDKNLQYLA
jgi:hypothetical protein